MDPGNWRFADAEAGHLLNKPACGKCWHKSSYAPCTRFYLLHSTV